MYIGTSLIIRTIRNKVVPLIGHQCMSGWYPQQEISMNEYCCYCCCCCCCCYYFCFIYHHMYSHPVSSCCVIVVVVVVIFVLFIITCIAIQYHHVVLMTIIWLPLIFQKIRVLLASTMLVHSIQSKSKCFTTYMCIIIIIIIMMPKQMKYM